MAFQWFKLKVCQPSLLPSKFSIYKNFPCEVKVYQNLVLFAFCILWARKGWSIFVWTVTRRPYWKGERFHICWYMHCNVCYGCISRKCKNKTQKFSMLKKLLLVILIKKFIFKADNIKSGHISFLPAKFRRSWCLLFLEFGCKKWTFWLIWRQ